MAADVQAIIGAIDHTNLDPCTTEADILDFARAAQGSGIAALCVSPCYVETLVKHFPGGVPLCTVVGFPNGCETSEIKALSARHAFANGAKEVDMVVSLGRIKAGEYGHVYHDVQRVLAERPAGGVLKVILETGALTDQEIIDTVHMLNDLPIDFYKTSTGFKYPGASLHAAELIMRHKRADIRLKVSGGIRTIEEAQAYLDIGATRIGASKLLAACLAAQS